MKVTVFDDRACTLGEGPLWHPLRKQLFWFDILDHSLLTRTENGVQSWCYDDAVSAAGWIDENSLFMASANGLWRVNLNNGNRELVTPLEADVPGTRSNDGRADPWGGFWIGTMAYDAAKGAGAIYRYYRGAVQKLFDNITIPNAICFAPDRSSAYFTDTRTRQVMRVALDDYGWPDGTPEVLLDLAAEGLNPDGAVIDTDGHLWMAQWGASRVAQYSITGQFLQAVDLPPKQVTCPAFGGDALSSMYVTSALEGLSPKALKQIPEQGMTFVINDIAKGLPEPQVIL